MSDIFLEMFLENKSLVICVGWRDELAIGGWFRDSRLE